MWHNDWPASRPSGVEGPRAPEDPPSTQPRRTPPAERDLVPFGRFALEARCRSLATPGATDGAEPPGKQLHFKKPYRYIALGDPPQVDENTLLPSRACFLLPGAVCLEAA